MAETIVFVAAGLLLTLVVLALAYAFGLRAHSRPVRDLARRFHRAIGDPIQMRSAGTRTASASVIRHAGRTTGRMYETPVWAAPTDDGFVIAIVYGRRTDWLRNVLASGTAIIVHGGVAHDVDRPAIVPMRDVAAHFPATLRRIHRALHIDRCLLVRLVGVAKTSAPHARKPVRGGRDDEEAA